MAWNSLKEGALDHCCSMHSNFLLLAPEQMCGDATATRISSIDLTDRTASVLLLYTWVHILQTPIDEL
jgi:hypothetical protein